MVNTQYSVQMSVVELCTGNLSNTVNQFHSNKSNKKKQKTSY